jgi:hypothetical protein
MNNEMKIEGVAHAPINGEWVRKEKYDALAERLDRELREFAGFLTAYLPELHQFEVPKMLDAIAAFRAADSASVGEP